MIDVFGVGVDKGDEDQEVEVRGTGCCFFFLLHHATCIILVP